MSRVCIPDYEYHERIKKAAELTQKAGLDVLLVNSTESDYANVRYFSGFWPLFERAGVAISASGGAALMVGPECKIFAADVRITNIFPSLYYRESANPAYPEFKSSTTKTRSSIGIAGNRIRIGIGGYLDIRLLCWRDLKSVIPTRKSLTRMIL